MKLGTVIVLIVCATSISAQAARLSSSPDWSAEGDSDSARFGSSVFTAGDVNGDGYADVIVGARYFANGQFSEGAAFVFHGSATGLYLTADWSAESDQEQAQFGESVFTAGDVNGDGYSDVIVGAWRYANGHSNEGRAYVYHGSAAGLSPAPDWMDESDQHDAFFGASVSTAGDVNRDGYSDVVVGAFGWDNPEGAEGLVCVYHGSPAGLSATPDWTTESNHPNGRLGVSVACAGDVNGDGYDDVILGADTYDNVEVDEGRVFIHYGSSTGLSASPDWTAEGDQDEAYFGYSVAGAGDVNGDGYADVIVGATEFDNDQTDEGRAFVYLGSAGGPSTTPDWTAESNQNLAHFGNSVAGAGDVNGDGYADVIVGAELYNVSGPNNGRAYVYLGSATGLALAPVWTVDSSQSGANLGASVGTAGDVNGDGFSDVIVGVPEFANPTMSEGVAFVYHGSAEGLTPSWGWSGEGDQDGAAYGFAVGHAGDVNGDGYADVVVGAFRYDNGQGDEGIAFAYHGASAGLEATANWASESDQAMSEFGRSVAGAGDVDGDGYSDVLVGAPAYNNGQNGEGAAFLYRGSATGLATTSSWSAESDQSAAWFGRSVASAGDVNGDGYLDIAVGANDYANGHAVEGAAFVYHGSASGPSTSPDWSAESNHNSGEFGWSLACAGDVNADGYSDLIVGDFRYDDGDTDEGWAFVYHGSPGGLSLTPNWSAESDQNQALFGFSVAGAGDVNGDGYSDVIIGAYYYSNVEANEGRAYVYNGSATGLSSSWSWTFESDNDTALFGRSVSTAGDVNGDGYSDVLVGANYFDNVESLEGRVYLFHGSSAGVSASPDWSYESDQDFAYLGESVSTAGDVNGDGYSDIIVGAPGYDSGNSNEGVAYLFYGNQGVGLSQNPRQARADGSALTQLLSSSGSDTGVRLRLLAKTPAGRTWARLVWELKDVGTLFDLTGVGYGDWVDTTATGTQLDQLVANLVAETAYHWRARLQYYPNLDYGRWFSIGPNGANETDFRTGPCVVVNPSDVTCDGVDDDCDGFTDEEADIDCDDGLYCNGSETCDPLAGCQAGTAINCSDGVDCTVDSCNEVDDTCVSTPSDALCDNGLYCDGAETCDPVQKCQPGTPVNCQDSVACTNDSCDEVADTCLNDPVDAACDNGLYCDGDEYCDPALDCQTVSGSVPDCDDGLACTADGCDEANDRCIHTPDDAACNDGEYCNGIEYCDAASGCQPGTAVDCTDGVDCTEDGCDEVNDGCANIPNDALCDDGQYCNGAENCDAFADCQAGVPPNCNDGVTCTVDGCDEANDQCSNAPDHTVCDDGDYCNGTETCEAAGCQPGTAPDCDDGVSCTDDGCDEAGDSCTHGPNDSLCNDGNVCTTNTCHQTSGCQTVNNDGAACTIGNCDSTCLDGLCQGCTCNSAADCADGVGCTQDDCQTGMCINLPDQTACDNGLWCDGSEICDPVLDCQPGAAPDCDDSVGCTNDACDEDADECAHTADQLSCDDGLYCNGTEVCDLVLDCQPGISVDCDDGFACTTDSCQEDSDDCDHQLAAGMCLIDGNCVDADTDQPGNVCMACQPEESLTGWTPRPGGSECGESSCQDGVFTPAATCDGEGNCVEGTPEPCRSGACLNEFECEGVGEGSLILSAGRGLAPNTTVRADSPQIVLRVMLEAEGVGGSLQGLRLSFPGLEEVSFGLRQVHVRLYEDDDLDGELDAGSRLLGQVWMDQAAVELNDLALAFQADSQHQLLVEMSVVRAEEARSALAGVSLFPLAALLVLAWSSRRRGRRLMRAMAATGALVAMALLPLACDDSSLQSATFETRAEISSNADVTVTPESDKSLTVVGAPVEGDTFLLNLGD